MSISYLEKLVDSGEYNGAQSELETMLTVGNLSPAERAAALQVGCRTYFHLRNYYASVQMGQAAVELADAVGDLATLARARFHLGAAYLWLGDANSAVELFTAYLAAVEDDGVAPDLTELSGAAWLNLGTAHRLLEDWLAAVAALRRAQVHYSQRNLRSPQIQCWQEIAWCFLFMGDLDAAAVAQANACELLRGNLDEGLAAHQACVQARCFLLRGNREVAQALALQVLKGGHDADVMATACWIAGEASLDAGYRTEAASLAERALEYSKSCMFPHVVGCAYKLWLRTQLEFPGLASSL